MKNFFRRNVFIIIIFGAVILVVVAIFVNPLFVKSTIRFDTPEKAFAYDNTKTAKKILTMETSDDAAFVLFENGEKSIQFKYIVRDEKGWIPPIGQSVINDQRSCKSGSVVIHIKDHVDIFYIVKSDWFKSSNPSKDEVSDSLGSDFLYYVIPDGLSGGQDWFLSIKNLPKDYKLYIDGETITF